MMKMMLNGLLAGICLAVLVDGNSKAPVTTKATTKAPAPAATHAPAPAATHAPAAAATHAPPAAATQTPASGGSPGNSGGGNGASGMRTGSVQKWIGMLVTALFMLSYF
ncbi:cyclin-dependent kinase inhibitor 1C-like [Mercenaria mercenaria]|uniref:cyclin-dependent kinase inhibitor 1C-like n=1 Tax=Mercenaria mercenaria TaxID=6596 RepID=UPI00234EB16B|nr:cyclin-dependent kinase inhibitor 1C-like [Mercenaria mercenaria]